MVAIDFPLWLSLLLETAGISFLARTLISERPENSRSVLFDGPVNTKPQRRGNTKSGFPEGFLKACGRLNRSNIVQGVKLSGAEVHQVVVLSGHRAIFRAQVHGAHCAGGWTTIFSWTMFSNSSGVGSANLLSHVL